MDAEEKLHVAMQWHDSVRVYTRACVYVLIALAENGANCASSFLSPSLPASFLTSFIPPFLHLLLRSFFHQGDDSAKAKVNTMIHERKTRVNTFLPFSCTHGTS